MNNDRYNNLLNISFKVTDDYNESRRQDVLQIRVFLAHLSSISLGIVGFSIPVLGQAGIINDKQLYIIGLILLASGAIFSLWYWLTTTEDSIIRSYLGYKKKKEEIRRSLDNETFLLQNPDKSAEYKVRVTQELNTLQNERELIIQSDKFLYFLLTLFSLGLIFTITSVL